MAKLARVNIFPDYSWGQYIHSNLRKNKEIVDRRKGYGDARWLIGGRAAGIQPRDSSAEGRTVDASSRTAVMKPATWTCVDGLVVFSLKTVVVELGIASHSIPNLKASTSLKADKNVGFPKQAKKPVSEATF